jgi:hypothetical protein
MKLKRTFVILVGLLVIVTFISGCVATNIANVKNQDNVGKKVIISGMVQNTIKIGTLSRYTIKDATDTISVSSKSLPKEGDKIRVTGILMKDTILGYYIKAD